jgi:hypothetical protein
MEENKNTPNQSPSTGPHPDMTMLKGILLTAFGFLLVLFSYRIILYMILFVSGAYFIFHGLTLLNVPKVNIMTTKIKDMAKNLFS